MPWIPWDAVQKGGGWAVLLLLCIAFLLARSRGILMSEKDVDRVLAGRDAVVELYKIQLSQKDEALRYERARSDRIDKQVEKLLVHAETTTYALQQLRDEAKR